MNRSNLALDDWLNWQENLNPNQIDLSLDRIQEVKEKIRELWGFGPWSAEMILIGYLGRQDIWSVNDSSLQRGIKLAVKSTEDTEKIVRRFKPYRTLLARHIWKGLDEGRLA